MNTIEQQIEGVVDSILSDYSLGRDVDKIDLLRHPDKAVITDMIQKLLRIEIGRASCRERVFLDV